MQMPRSSAHRPCTSRSSSPKFSEICAVSCRSRSKMHSRFEIAGKHHAEDIQVFKNAARAISRIQKERFPDCGESVWRLWGSCWSMCTGAWGVQPWSALYCPGEDMRRWKKGVKGALCVSEWRQSKHQNSSGAVASVPSIQKKGPKIEKTINPVQPH